MKPFLKNAVLLWNYGMRPLKRPEQWAKQKAADASFFNVERVGDGGKVGLSLGSGKRMEAHADSWAELCAWVKQPCFAHCCVTWRIPGAILDKGVA